MPEAVLAGPNGQPAIDQITGMPLTMEELLRRRGILSVGGVVSPLNSVPVASPAQTALADSADATAANSDGSNAAIGASPNTLNELGVPQGATEATPTAMQTAESAPGPDASEDEWLAWLLGAGALGAGAYALSKLRGRKAAAAAPEVPLTGEVLPSHVRTPVDGPSINNTLTRVDNGGSNQVLNALIDGKNVARAGEIGAGPKALSGPAPVTDLRTEGEYNLASAVARQRGIPDYYEGPSRGPQSRMEYGARKAAYMREGTSNSDPIMLRDRYTDLSPEERTLASEIAGRLKAERESGRGKLPARIGTTKVNKQRNKLRAATRTPAYAPAALNEQTLAEAVAIVRKMRTTTPNLRTVSTAARRVRP